MIKVCRHCHKAKRFTIWELFRRYCRGCRDRIAIQEYIINRYHGG